MATGYLRLRADMPSTALQQKLFDLIGNKEVMRETHRILGEICEPYVPKNSGELRKSMRAYPKSVKWETPYAHYQYVGRVYAPNFPMVQDGKVIGFRTYNGKRYPIFAEGIGRIIGWYSIKGMRKQITGRRIGTAGSFMGQNFGYRDPKTSHHWFDEAMKNGGRRTFSLRVTNMLKAEAKKRNKTW